MGSGNWIVDNLNSALGTWNGKLAEIWQLLSTTPEEFKGGGVWTVIQGINGALQAIGCALLVLFFVMGIVKTCSSFTELKKPEMVFKCFIRFVLAQAAVTHGMELMTALFKVAQGMISTIMTASGLSALTDTTLPAEMVTIIEDVGFLESIPLWAITLLGSLFIWVLSLIMILTVYSRFFKLYLATAIAPIPMASFAGQPSSSIGVAFLKSYAAICLEGCIIVFSLCDLLGLRHHSACHRGRYLGGGHHLDFLVGYQALTTDTEYDAAFGRNTNNDFYQTLGDTKALGRYFSGFNNKWNWMNVYANIDYRMLDLLKLGLTASWDGASSIGQDATRMTFYPAGDITFMAAQLPGLRESEWLDKLNVYANYGLTGNSRFSTKLGKYYYTSTPYQTVAGIIRANVPNTKIKAERDLTLNVGLETSLLNNRLQIGAGYYNIDARDVLMAGERSSVFGTSSYYNNDARIESKGFEASLSVMPVNTGDFRWMIGGNITTLNNKIRSLGNLDRIITKLDNNAQMITEVGGDPYAFYGYRALGVFSTTAEAEAANLVNRSGTPYQAGDIHYEDVDGNGIINDNDRQVLGSATPDFFGSFFTRLEWRNWALDLTFAYSHGNKAYNAVRRLTESGKDFSNQSTALMRRWSMEGQVTDIPRVSYGDKVGNNDFSDRWIEDASYVKLRDITVSYTWDKPFLSFFQGGTIYVTGENLLTATKYLGLDPEFSYSNSTVLQGVDYGKVGAPRSVKLGVNLKF